MLSIFLLYYCLIWSIKRQICTFSSQNGDSLDSAQSKINVQTFIPAQIPARISTHGN